MAMKMLRDGAKGGLGKFILVGFMALAVGGLVLMDMGGFFRGGGVSGTDAAKIGRQRISIQDFDQFARGHLQRIGLSTQDAYKMGYIQQLLHARIRNALLARAAQDMNINISDAHIAEHVKKLLAPMVVQGASPKDVLERILVSQGLSEAAFSASIKQDMSVNLLTDSLLSGLPVVHDEMIRTLYNLQNEKRTIEYIALADKDIDDGARPDDTTLQKVYEATKEEYALPETRALQLVELDTKTLRDSLAISDDQIKREYESNLDFYKTQKTWRLEQALLSNNTQANEVLKAVQNGQDMKEAVISLTKQPTSYIGMDDFTESRLQDAIKESLATADAGDLIDHTIKTPLGVYVIRVVAINAESVKPLESVKEDIRQELSHNALADQLYDAAGQLDDIFASGTTPENAAKDIDLTLTSLPAINANGFDSNNTNILEVYPALQNAILKDGFSLEEGETSPVHETDDGRFIAIHIKKIHPRTYPDFADIRDKIETKWAKDNKRLANKAKADSILDTLSKSSGQNLAESGMTVLMAKDISATSKPVAPLLERSILNIFQAPKGEAFILDVDGGLAIAKVTEIKWPTGEASEKDIEDIRTQIEKEQQEEVLSLYLNAAQDKYGVKINARLLDKMYNTASEN